MKKVCLLFMLLCSLTTFAANVNTSYAGTLKVNVDGETTTIENQQISVIDNGDGTVTMNIPDFQFAGFTGTVAIVANIASDGALSNPKVSFSNLPILRRSFYSTSYVSTSASEVHLKMYCLTKTITVDYSGK